MHGGLSLSPQPQTQLEPPAAGVDERGGKKECGCSPELQKSSQSKSGT